MIKYRLFLIISLLTLWVLFSIKNWHFYLYFKTQATKQYLNFLGFSLVYCELDAKMSLQPQMFIILRNIFEVFTLDRNK